MLTHFLKAPSTLTYLSSLSIKANILSGQKFIKNASNSQFGKYLKKPNLAAKQCYQTGYIKMGLKLLEIAKTENVKCDNFSDFQTLCIQT